MTRRMCTRCWVFVGVAVALGLVLAACAFSPNEPPMTHVPLSVSPSPEKVEGTPGSQVAIPHVVAGKEEQGKEVAAARVDSGEVWKPREIAAQVQVILAKKLDVDPEKVPWLRYETQVDTKNLVCLDQLVSNVPPIADGEALVYEHEGQEVYVVGNQGQLWVCRKKED